MSVPARLVLLVEDSVDDELLTRKALEKSGLPIRVAAVRDGPEALDFLFREGRHAGRAPEPPAFALLDLKLPKVDGLQVLARLRADPRTRCLPVVVLSSSSQEEDVAGAYRLGASSYIRKPVDFEQFIRTIQQAASYWLLVNEPPPGPESGPPGHGGEAA